MERDYDRFVKRVAKNIAALRKARKLTQEGMTEFGYSYRHYQRIEGGKNAPNLQTLHRLALTFKVDISTFFQ